jgi:hypothetical protein
VRDVRANPDYRDPKADAKTMGHAGALLSGRIKRLNKRIARTPGGGPAEGLSFGINMSQAVTARSCAAPGT